MMYLKSDKNYKCPYCSKISDYIEVSEYAGRKDFICPKCDVTMFYSISHITYISCELNIKNKESVIIHNTREVERITIDKNQELIFEYK